MDAEHHDADQHIHIQGSAGFSLQAAREVLSVLTSIPLGDSEDPKQKAVASSLAEYERQLNSIESLYRVQTSLALEFGLHGALAEGCADAVGNTAELAADPHTIAAALPDVFSITDFADFADREHVRALSYQASCPQEAVRKELRAIQKAVGDRLKLAAKRCKAQGQEPPPLAAAGVQTAPAFRTASPSPTPQPQPSHDATGSSSHGRRGSKPQPHQEHQQQEQQEQQRAAVVPVMDERLYFWDEAEEATRRAQLAKLTGLLHPETGGICKDPISTVGVFQQLMTVCQDWRVRRAALEAMSRSAPDVQWRLLQNSKVLDSLYGWLQDAVVDQQSTMMQLMLNTMVGLPMPRYLLKGSRLEAALESLAGGGRHGGGAAAAAAAAVDDGSPNACMPRRFGATAAGVLAEWRKDPDQATILRRAGGAAPDAPAAAAAKTPSASPATAGSGAAAAHPIPGSRLLGAAAAAKDGMRKRGLTMPRAQADARPAARPRVLEPGIGVGGGGVGGGGGGGAAPGVASGGGGVSASGRGSAAGPGGAKNGTAGGGGAVASAAAATAAVAAQGGAKRAPLASATPPTRGSAKAQADSKKAQTVDMTAKLGEKGPADPDVVAGFRSRFGDGSVRRSQLTLLPARGASAPTAAPSSAAAAAGAKEPSPGPAPAPAAAASRAGAEASSCSDATTVTELGPDDLTRLRAEREAQRQAKALLALQAEARRHPEVAAAELEYQTRLSADREALRQEQRRWVPPEEVRRRVAAMRETVPWTCPPVELALPQDEAPEATGDELTERLERARERERVPKVSYPSPDRIPDSPAEPAATAQQQQQGQGQQGQVGPPLRAIPWTPSADTEDGALDWFRQNRVLWETGARRAELVLPPFLLHKHLDLAPELLPPHLMAPPDTPALPTMKPQLRPQSHHAPGGPGAQRRSVQAPPPTGSDPPPQAASAWEAAAAADADWLPAPAVQQQQQQQRYHPQHPTPASHAPPAARLPVVPEWEPTEPGAPQLLSEPATLVVLSAAAAPTILVPFMPAPQTQPLQLQLQPQSLLSYSQGQVQYEHHVGLGSQSQPLSQPLYEYGHMNGHSAAGPGSGAWQPPEERTPYGYAGDGYDGGPPRKHGQPPQQPGYYEQQQERHHHRAPPAYQQPETAQHYQQRHDAYAPYGHRYPGSQNGRGVQHDSPARGDCEPGSYGGYYDQQEQQRSEYHRGRREPRGYQPPR